MTAWVLILVLRISSGTSAIAVDMPSEPVCIAAIETARKTSTFASGFCLSRVETPSGLEK